MKTTFSKLFATVLLGSSLICNAYATPSPTPYYGSLQPQAKLTAAAHDIVVTLVNLTWDSYTAYTLYQPSGAQYATYLGPEYTSTDTIYYTLYFPDNQVCFHVDRNWDGALVYEGCVWGGSTVYIYPYPGVANDQLNGHNYLQANAKNNNKPLIKVVNNKKAAQ
jgi:hypothetical protein